MRYIFLGLILPAVVILVLGSCGDENPVASKQSPVPSFYPHAVGTYWVYADTTYDMISSEVVSVSLDSVAVIGVYGDSLGTWAVLNHGVSWVTDTFMVAGDTLFSRQIGYTGEPGPIPIFASAEYIPAGDTSFVFNVVHGDLLERRTVVDVDTPLVCDAGSFDDCVLYFEAGATEIVYHDILAPNVGLVYCALEIKPMSVPEYDHLSVKRLIRYHIAD